MFGITRRTPDPMLDLLYNLERRMGRFPEPFAGFEWPLPTLTTAAWTPVVDIVEEPEAIRIVAELPGVKPEDVKISLEGNLLTISGKKEQVAEEKAEKVHRYERTFGAFEQGHEDAQGLTGGRWRLVEDGGGFIDPPLDSTIFHQPPRASTTETTRMKTMPTVGTLLLLVAPLAAQQPGRPDTVRGMMGPMHMMSQMMGHMEQMHEMMQPMMRGMAFAPDHLLGRKDALGLTPQQVTRLTVLRDAAKTAHDAAHAQARTQMQALSQTLAADAPDTVAARRQFRAAHDAMGRAHWTMLAAAAQAKAALTDAQRGRVEGWVDAREGHQMEMRQGMPMGPRPAQPPQPAQPPR